MRANIWLTAKQQSNALIKHGVSLQNENAGSVTFSIKELAVAISSEFKTNPACGINFANNNINNKTVSKYCSFAKVSRCQKSFSGCTLLSQYKSQTEDHLPTKHFKYIK